MSPPSTRAVRLVRSFGIAALFLAAALFGIAGGVTFAFVGDLPEISALDDYSPGTITKVLGRDGTVVGELATERRQIVTYDQIPPVLRNAIVSVEDETFFTHGGLRVERIAIAAMKNVFQRRVSGGASTITQQLARNLFPETVGFERLGLAGLERKVKEAAVAIQIEKRYTKQEIFTMYCNKLFWGHRSYGVEAASQLYFAKQVSELTLDEAALIAGIIQGNQRQSPYKDMKLALGRRNWTLERMARAGHITREEADAAKKRPIVTLGQPSAPRTIAPYFVEQIRIQLEDKYGAKALLENGFTIRTGLDPALQRTANRALNAQLRQMDKQRGVFRKPQHNLIDEKRSIENYTINEWTRDPAIGDVLPAIVTSIDGQTIAIRVGRWQGTIDKPGYAWARRAAEVLVRRGDVIEAKIQQFDPKTGTLTASLEQPPAVQGAVVALDNHTGQIMVMIGGANFDRSQFNRAVQAMRQVGSLFKPFVFTAAIDRGYTASSTLLDAPASFNAGAGQPPYQPQNYEKGVWKGEVPLRTALEDSLNVPTVRLMEALGPKTVIGYAQRLGITSPIPPYLSSAIGAGEATLLQVTSAYTSFPNQGVRMTPLYFTEVTDRDGNILEQHRSQPHEAIRADTAYIMTGILQGVIARGTGATAAVAPLKAAQWPMAGKTGTTDDYTDAWFVGFDPDITIGVWIGYDMKRPLGGNATGGVVALPIWSEIMKTWIEQRGKELTEPPGFSRPGNVIFINGEAYIAGTEPGRQ